MTLLVSSILWFEERAALVCDGRCHKAWGINSRPHANLSADPDDFAYLADDELGEAPVDPGTYEGGHGKPTRYDDPARHNKWCARECERSVIVKGRGAADLPDFTQRLYNKPGPAGAED